MFDSFKYKKLGFTLAEVLITIGVIGVVAAMTIPTLVMNNQKQIVEAKLKKLYAVATNACEQMLIQENVYAANHTDLYGVLSTSSSTNSQVNEIIKTYFNPIKESASSSEGWPIYLADGSVLYVKARSDSFLFRAIPEQKQTKYTYDFLLTPKCSLDYNILTSNEWNAFKAVINNDWKIPN